MAAVNMLYDVFCNNEDGIMRCKLCDKFVTVLPIYYVDEIGSVCGRCTRRAQQLITDETQFNRQTVIETLIRKSNLPCSNAIYGCSAILKLDDVLEHESACNYKKELCPLYFNELFEIEEKCAWNGKSSELVNHVEENHAELIVYNPLQLTLTTNGKSTLHFNRVELELITIVCKHLEKNRYSFFVMVHGNEEEALKYSADLKVSNESGTNTITLHKNTLQSLHNFVKHFNYNECMFEVDMEKAHFFLNYDKQVLVECYIRPKQYSGFNESTRKLYCTNKNEGCKYVSYSSDAIALHELNCKWQIIDCVLKSTIEKCNWVGARAALVAHFQSQHKKLLFKENVEKTQCFFRNFPTWYMEYFVFDDQLFIFNRTIRSGDAFIIISYSNNDSNYVRYNFLLQIFDPEQPLIFLSIPGTCIARNLGRSYETATVITSKMLDNFRNIYLLNFKIKIFKKDL